MDRIKDKHAAQLTTAGSIGGAPFVARTPRPQRSAIPNLRGLSASLGAIMEKRDRAQDLVDKTEAGAEAQEFFAKFGGNQKQRKILGEMIASSNPIRREQWQRAAVNNYVTAYAKRYTESLEEAVQDVARNPGQGGLRERAKSLGQKVLADMEEEAGDLFANSSYQRDLFYGQVNELIGGRGGLGGLEAKALQAFSRAEEHAGEIAITGALSDQMVMAVDNASDPMNPTESATDILKHDLESLQANYDDLSKGRDLGESAKIVEASLLTTIDRLATRTDQYGEPMYENEDLAQFLTQMSGVKVLTPSEGPGRPKKVPLIDRSDALRGRLQALTGGSQGVSGGRAQRIARKAVENNFAELEKAVDSLTGLGKVDPLALETSVAQLTESLALTDENSKARAETLIRQEMIAMRDLRLGQFDQGKEVRTKSFTDQILLETDPEKLSGLRELAVAADADPLKVQAAIQERLSMNQTERSSPALGAAKSSLTGLLEVLDSPNRLRQQEDALFTNQIQSEYQELVLGVTSIEDEIERAAAIKALPKSPEYQALLTRVTERRESYETTRQETRGSLDSLVNSGKESEAWRQSEVAHAQGLISERERDAIRKQAAKVADPTNYKSERLNGAIGNFAQLLKAEAQSDAGRRKLTSGLLKGAASDLGLSVESSADPAKYVEITSKITESLMVRQQEIVNEVLQDESIKGYVSKIQAVEERMINEVKALRQKAGYDEGQFLNMGGDKLSKIWEEVEGIKGKITLPQGEQKALTSHFKSLKSRDGRTLISDTLPEKYRGSAKAGVTVDEDFMADRVGDVAKVILREGTSKWGGNVNLATPMIGGVLPPLDKELVVTHNTRRDFMKSLATQSNTGMAARVFVGLARKDTEMQPKTRALALGQIVHHLGVPAEEYLSGGKVGPFGVYSGSPQGFFPTQDAVDELDAQIKVAARQAGMKWTQEAGYYGGDHRRSVVRSLELQKEYLKYASEDLYVPVKSLPIDPWDTPFYTKDTIEAAVSDPATRKKWREALGVDERAMIKWWKTQQQLAR